MSGLSFEPRSFQYEVAMLPTNQFLFGDLIYKKEVKSELCELPVKVQNIARLVINRACSQHIEPAGLRFEKRFIVAQHVANCY